ncbi:hypothetical protein O6H91_02G041900 [Diphasiastrum complanatum]|nr:hypothetical protein O6H91_02G041900 [Diphasiastrum complanatum]
MLSTPRCDHMRSFGGEAAAFSEVCTATLNRKERLSRKERANVVETFVLKHMALNQGRFPSASIVVKETGGSRLTVKEILSELEGRVKAEAAKTDGFCKQLESAEKELGSSIGEGTEMLTRSTSSSDTSHSALNQPQETVVPISGDVGGIASTRLKNADSDGKLSDELISEEKTVPEERITNLRIDGKGTLWERLHAITTSGHQQSCSQVFLESRNKRTVSLEKVHGKGTSYKYPSMEKRTSKKLISAGRILSKEQIPKLSNDGKRTLWERLHAVTTGRPESGAEFSSEANSKTPPVLKKIHDEPSLKPKMCSLPREGESAEGDDTDFTSLDYPQLDDLESASHGFSVPDEGAVLRADVQDSGHEVCVRFLHIDATEADLREAFWDCGQILRAKPVPRKNPDAPLTYGFIRFDTEEGFKKAIRKEVLIKGIKVKPCPSISPVRSLSMKARRNLNITKRTGPDDHVQDSPVLNNLKNLPDCKGYPVMVENIPASILSEVKEALATHGEIVRSYYKDDDSGAAAALISFQSEEAKENALAAHWVHLGGKQFRVSRLDSPRTTVVRISNISYQTDEDRIVNACKSCGYFQKVEPRASGVVDVYFHPKESGNMIRILDRLNEVHMDRHRWQAQPAPRLSPRATPEFSISADGQRWIKSQQFQIVEKLETTISKAMLQIEDLKYLLSLQWHGRSSDSGEASPSNLISLTR